MTLIDEILHLLRMRPGGMTDAELARATGKIHQHINQSCRRMALDGLLVRESTGRGIVNRLRNAEAPRSAPRPRPVPSADREWYWEGNVQAMLCCWLEGQGWTLTQVADTASKERGTDIVARRGGQRLHVEVKGFPSKSYADPRRANEVKRTDPTLQAKHWYADALLKVLRLRETHPEDRVAMAFPTKPRYRSLLAETATTLRTMRIDVFLLEEDGEATDWKAYDGG